MVGRGGGEEAGAAGGKAADPFFMFTLGTGVGGGIMQGARCRGRLDLQPKWGT